jgi:hypothetical protein
MKRTQNSPAGQLRSWRARQGKPRPCRLLCVFLFLAALPPLRGDNLFGSGGNLQVGGFVSRSLDSSGRTEWELRGDEAHIRGQSTELNDFTIVFMQKDSADYTLSSPRCRYLHSAAEVKSDAPVFVEGDGMSISGIGYDVYLDAKIVIIRSTVMMKIKQRKGALRENVRRISAEEGKTPKAPQK